MSQKDPKISYVESKLKTNLPSLYDNGYKYIGYTLKASKVVRDRYVFEFNNSDLKITINIVLGLAANGADDRFTISIISLSGDSFLLSNYFSKYKIFTEKDYFLLTSYSGSFEEKVDGFFGFLNNAFKNKLNDILFLGKWESIPFNWHGYR